MSKLHLSIEELRRERHDAIMRCAELEAGKAFDKAKIAEQKLRIAELEAQVKELEQFCRDLLGDEDG